MECMHWPHAHVQHSNVFACTGNGLGHNRGCATCTLSTIVQCSKAAHHKATRNNNLVLVTRSHSDDCILLPAPHGALPHTLGSGRGTLAASGIVWALRGARLGTQFGSRWHVQGREAGGGASGGAGTGDTAAAANTAAVDNVAVHRGRHRWAPQHAPWLGTTTHGCCGFTLGGVVEQPAGIPHGMHGARHHGHACRRWPHPGPPLHPAYMHAT
jgi:hypothetical protein